MACIQSCHKYRFIILSMFFLLVSSLTQVRILAEGRKMYKLVEEAQRGRMEKKAEERGQLIGSRPPICERRCNSCGHCEAIQVPVAPKRLQIRRSSHYLYAAPRIAYSRGEDISNYKPMSWKCKCGDLIFNP